ncbi:MAG: hydroxyacylglutathione hydrolase [Gammaproteobacteria bacterium]|nr:hydroxyacylglutathione hydrolase [Gammaproteobacteria bacterium]
MIFASYIPAFNDNYIWLIHKENNKNIVIVDPGDAKPVLETIRQHQYQPVAILITHHHSDHVGGINQLKARYDIPVYGPANENIAAITHPLKEGDNVTITELDLTLQVLDVPGHTRGHIAYYSNNMLFCGDTLFTGGCGGLFEGTAEQMHHSLNKIAALPDETQIYCAHEYTLDNLNFARVVEPENKALLQRIKDTQAKRKLNKATVPAKLALEKDTNPFLRCDVPDVIQAAEQFALKRLKSGTETFATVRHWKDTLD